MDHRAGDTWWETYPEHVSILEMGLWVTLLSMDEVREL